MSVVATLLVRVAANLTELDKTFSELERAADRVAKAYAKLGGQLQTIGSKLTTGLTLPLAAIGVAAGKSAMDFDTAMREVQAAIDPTKNELDVLKAAAIEWGQKTQFSATEAAQALAELGKAGIKSGDAVALLPSVLNLATVGQMDLAEAAATTTDTLSQFNLTTKDAGRVNDVLAAGAQKSTTSVKELRNSLVQVGSVAANFGMSIEESVGALAAFANNGLKGEKAGTALKNVVTSIINPMKGMNDVMGELGLKTLAGADGTVHLTDVVRKLGDAGATQAQIVRAFGEVAGPAMVGMVSKGVGVLTDMTTAMEQSGGTADRVAKTLMSGLGGAWEQMTGAIETASISIGTILAPALQMAAGLVGDLAEFVSGTLVPAFEALPTGVKVAAGAFVGLLGAIGPLVYIAGTLAQSWSGLVSLFGKTAGAAGDAAGAAKNLTTGLDTTAISAKLATYWTSAFSAVVAVLSSPITWVVAAVAALVLGLRVLTGSWEGVLRVLTAGLVDFKTLAQLWDGLKTVGQGVADGFTILQGAIRDAVATIATEFTPAVDAMRRLVVDVGAAIRKPLAAAMTELGIASGDAAKGGMQQVLRQLYDIGRAVSIEGALTQLRGQLSFVTGSFGALADGMTIVINTMRGQLLAGFNALIGLMKSAWAEAQKLAGVFNVDLPGALRSTIGLFKSLGLDIGATGNAATTAWGKLAAGVPTLSDLALRAQLGAEGYAKLKAQTKTAGDSFKNFVPGVTGAKSALDAAGLSTGQFGDDLNRLAVGTGPTVRSLGDVTAATARAGQVSKEAADAAKKAAEDFKKLHDAMSGKDAIDKANELTKVLASLTAQGLKPTKQGAKDVSDALDDAADAIRRNGKTVPEWMGKLWASLQPPTEVVDDLRNWTDLFGRSISRLVPTLQQNLRPVTKAFVDAFRIPDPNLDKQLTAFLRSADLKDAVTKWGADLKTQVTGTLSSMFTGQTGFADGFRSMFDGLQGFATNIVNDFATKFQEQLTNAFKGEKFDWEAIFGGKAGTKAGAIAGSAVGATVGAMMGTKFGTEFGAAAGVAIGAASGAMTGFMIGRMGGPQAAAIGTIVGAGVGAISGWFAALKAEEQQRKQIAHTRSELLVTFGTIGDLTAAANRLHVSMDALWNTDDPIRFQAAIEHLNLALADEEKFVAGLSKSLTETSKSGELLSKSLMTDMGKRRDAPGADEAVFGFMTAQTTSAIEGIDAFLSNATVKTKSGAAAISATIAGLFESMRSQGMAPTEAFAALEPVIGKLQKQLTEAGLAGAAAFTPLADLATLSADAIAGPMFDAMAGLATSMTTTFNLGLMNQDAFEGFTAELLAGYKTLELQGKGGVTAMAGMQGAIQKAWELSEDFGYSLGEGEKQLVDYALQAGLVGDQFRPATDRMVIAVDKLVDRLDKFLTRLEGVGPAAATASNEIANTLGRTNVPVIDLRFRPVIVGELPSGATIDTTTVPALGGGGVVRRPTLALIGESGPEAVVPLSSSFGSTTDVTLMLDSEVLTRAVLRKQPRIMRAYGAAR